MSSEALERAPLIARELHHWAAHLDGFADRDRVPRGAEARLLREAAALVAALAVAREREQRATDGCEKAAETFAELAEALTLLRHPTLAAACHIAEAGTRAALVDEPAAATLAEPGRRDANGPAVVLGEASLPGSASAAADEPGETPA